MKDILILKSKIPAIVQAASTFVSKNNSATVMALVISNMQMAWYFWEDAAQVGADAMISSGDVLSPANNEITAEYPPALLSNREFLQFLETSVSNLKESSMKVLTDSTVPHTYIPQSSVFHLKSGIQHVCQANYYIKMAIYNYETTGRI